MYDVAIIGGGPAGYLAAERLGHHGKKVLLIEKSYLGGTCLNVGCVPTKTLLNSAKHYAHALEAHRFGVQVQGVSYDWQAILNWKTEVVEKLRNGIEGMMKKYAVGLVEGTGEILSPPRGEAAARVRVVPVSGGTPREYECASILVCTGSVPVMPPIPGIKDNPGVVDSTGLLSISAVPKGLTVIGGGVIGVEFASLFSSLGTKVSVIEMMDEIVPFMDREQAPLLRRAMKGIDFKLGCRVERLEGATVHYSTKSGVAEKVEGDLVLMAVGRRPVLSHWGAEAVGVDVRPTGVVVDDRMRTNVSGIWAAGDLTGKSLLAHSAYRMGEVAVADILSYLDGTPPRANRMRYDAIPWAVYGIPEAAGVGLTEQEAAAKGIPVLKGSIPMRLSGRFAAENTFAGQGAVKVIAAASGGGAASGGADSEGGAASRGCAESGRILGVHAVGPYASEFIWGAAALIEQELRIADVKQLIFPHPTVCELIRDVVWTLDSR